MSLKTLKTTVLARNPRSLAQIPPGDVSYALAHFKELKRILAEGGLGGSSGAPFPKTEAAAAPDMLQAMRDICPVATNAWRAKSKMVDPNTGQVREDMARIYRHIEGIFDGMAEMGVRIDDPKDQNYDPGMALKVVTFQRTPGLSRDRIVETIKPSVFWKDNLIQMGEVIVGTPETPEPANS